MLGLGLDTYYFEILKSLNLLEILRPDISLSAPDHLCTPKMSIVGKTK